MGQIKYESLTGHSASLEASHFTPMNIQGCKEATSTMSITRKCPLLVDLSAPFLALS